MGHTRDRAIVAGLGGASGGARAWAVVCAGVLGVGAGVSAPAWGAGVAPAEGGVGEAAQLGAPSLRELVDGLGSAEYSRREGAMAQLRDRWGLRVSDVAEAMSRPGLSAEQLVRLEQLAHEVYVRTPRGALGVQLRNLNNQVNPELEVGVQVVRVSDGFPAKGVLMPEDVILEIGGREVRRSRFEDTLRARVISHDPGQVVLVTVLRVGERLTLPVELGSWESFDRNAGVLSEMLSTDDLHRGWEERRAGLPVAGAALPVGKIDRHLASRSPGREIGLELAAGGFGEALGVDAGGEPSAKSGERTGLEGPLRWGQGNAGFGGIVNRPWQQGVNRPGQGLAIRGVAEHAQEDGTVAATLVKMEIHLDTLIQERNQVLSRSQERAIVNRGVQTEAQRRLIVRIGEELRSLEEAKIEVRTRLKELGVSPGARR